MTIYIATLGKEGATVAKIQDDGISPYQYFAGYDFMGSVNWTGPDGYGAVIMDLEEAEQIASDLQAAE